MTKKIIITMMILFLFKSLPTYAAEPLPNIVELTLDNKIATFDGRNVKMDIPPLIIEGVTLVPIRFVTQDMLGATVEWNPTYKEIKITQDNTVVKLWVGSNKATINGTEIMLSQGPTVQDGRSLIPLRFISENFGLKVSYNSSTHKIILQRLVPIEIILPIANFTLLNPEIIAGETLNVIDSSFHPGGYKIIDRLWELQLQTGEKVQSKTISSTLLNKYNGSHILRLKVKDEYGQWSESVESPIVIMPNQAPVITSLQSDYSIAAQGQKLQFYYEKTNEAWDQIVEERWVYRWYDSDGRLRQVIGKPDVLFGERTYTIGLSIKDSYNNWSKEAVTQVTTTSTVIVSEYSYRFSIPKTGDIILNAGNMNKNLLPDAPWEVSRSGPTLILSNSPERVTTPGIAYRDVINGDSRLYYYHKNSMATNGNLLAIAENKSGAPIEITFNKQTFNGPVTDEMHLGQLVSAGYISSNTTSTVILQPGGKYTINSQQSSKIIKPDEIISGMLDIMTTGPIEVTVAMIDANSTYNASMKYLSSDNIHPRGTYKNSNITINVTPNGLETQKILIGKGTNLDYFLRGIDALTGDEVINKGNYGVIYNINVTTEAVTGVFFNPRGTKFKGSIQAFDSKVYLIPEKGSFENSVFSAVIGVLGIGESGSLVYTPPGGSDTPIVIGFMPSQNW